MRILPPILFTLSAAAMFGSWWAIPDLSLVPPRLQSWGWVPFGVGLLVALAANRHFYRRKTNIMTFDEPTILVSDGLFRWSRNPMYAGMVMAMFGLAWVFGGPGEIAIAVLFFVVTAAWYIPFEERAMRAKFGPAFTDYAARTRRWL